MGGAGAPPENSLSGAGERNRTAVPSLENSYSTIELRPQRQTLLARSTGRMVGDRGIEPRTSRSQTERSTDELVSVFVGRQGIEP